ncbi:MAG: Holliday junction resolvase RuvX [Gemmatimonadota bacterium]|jgi:putative Holliday junction resolvase|nr:Holliday junction resolvase RuvX [Gemmatimonadota bacterium]MDP6803132.1 Holliday junction resolvase RuvX [Gemmatimonadota bacterium]MDP7031911.1 Holliday junction resolvase RuvX [Gemmatimonadota bacterium]
MAFDFGDRRIGVAVSDPLRIAAEALPTILRPGNTIPWKEVVRTIRRAETVQLVVGDPLQMDGTPGERSSICREFAEELGRRTSLPVDLQDERLSSVEAERTLSVDPGSRGKRQDKADVDRVAAILILRGWLDRADTDASS